MSLPRYGKYKESGAHWVGQVPAHWAVGRLKSQAVLVTEKAVQRTHPVALENIEGWSGTFIPSDGGFEGEGVAFLAGDILFGKLRPYLAKAYLAECPGEAVGDFHVLRPAPAMRARYLQYQILNRAFIDVIDGSTFGSKMPRASWECLGNMTVALPPLDEQTAIAAFLDRETAKIDALIAEQEKLIVLLAEKRQATISRAVTKSLNPNAPTKDSGVAWLGEAPAHWEISRIKYHCLVAGRIGFRGYTTNDQVDDGEGALVLGATHITFTGELTFESPTYISWEKYYESPEIIVKPEDILVVQRGSTCGKVGFVANDHGPTTINPSLVLLKDFSCISRFLFFYLSSSLVQGFFASKLGKTAIPMLSQEQIGNVAFCIPPKTEQEAIVAFLESEITLIDALKVQAERAIELLKERRGALIAAAVTGQVDVRSAVAQNSTLSEAMAA